MARGDDDLKTGRMMTLKIRRQFSLPSYFWLYLKRTAYINTELTGCSPLWLNQIKHCRHNHRLTWPPAPLEKNSLAQRHPDDSFNLQLCPSGHYNQSVCSKTRKDFFSFHCKMKIKSATLLTIKQKTVEWRASARYPLCSPRGPDISTAACGFTEIPLASRVWAKQYYGSFSAGGPLHQSGKY